MLNITEDFNKYLKEWCAKNHKPLPETTSTNKFWKEAWQDYLKEYLPTKYDELKTEYLDMELLKVKDANKNKIEDEQEESESLSNWDMIQQFLK